MRVNLFVNAIVTVCLFTAGAVASENQCLSLFTRSAWDKQLEIAYAHFSENLFNPGLENQTSGQAIRPARRKTIHDGYNNFEYPHSRILRDVFGVKLGRNGKAPTIDQIINSYSREMEKIVRSGKITRRDVLMPAFVFKLGKRYFWLKYGDPIPAGAKSAGDVLSPYHYNKMVSEGFFPLGNQFITQTRISSFEHDLAHLTSFLQYPEYMAQIKKLAIETFEGSIVRRDEMDMRSYFLGESLSLINGSNKNEMFSRFMLPPGKNIYALTHKEVLDHLNTLPREEVREMLEHLANHYQKYFDNMGGSTRDYVNGTMSAIHMPYRVMISEALADLKYEGSLKTTASMQIIFIRLSQTKLEDWFDSVGRAHLEPGSPLDKFFKDDVVWDIEDGDYRYSFTGKLSL